jgi:hypothetical protein
MDAMSPIGCRAVKVIAVIYIIAGLGLAVHKLVTIQVAATHHTISLLAIMTARPTRFVPMRTAKPVK